MQKGLFVLILLLSLLSGRLNAQDFKYLVTDSATNEPIIGATITEVKSHKTLAVTDVSGQFTLKSQPNGKVAITYIGYKTLTTTLAPGHTYHLASNTRAIDEVVVTAQESRGLTATSIIGKKAMELLQPSSFTDILELLPGGMARDPSLTAPNTIRLRETRQGGSSYTTSSLGTRFVVDGSPISTNANMQYLSGTWETAATSRDFVNEGVDMRSIPTDDIEQVEIVRGIPSVEYGDLTSGLVKIKRKKGLEKLSARMKSDMTSQLFHLSKGFEWKRGWMLNVSADYMHAHADPRNNLENYHRITGSFRLNKTWNNAARRLTYTNNFDYGASIDGEKEDPDMNSGQTNKYKSTYNRFNYFTELELKLKKSQWLKSVDFSLSTAYEHDLVSRTRFTQLQRTTVAATSLVEGESDAVILENKYTATHEADGKPFNMFAKLNARLQVPLRFLTNSLLIGTDWNIDKNYGRGQIFDPEHPIYPGLSARPRKLSEIPAEHQLSFYAEENLRLPIGPFALEAVGGLRSMEMLNLPKEYYLHGKTYLDKRANVGITFPQFKLLGRTGFVRVAAGWGEQSKMPTMEQLFPDKAYIDLIELNYYNPDPAKRRVYIKTYVINPANPELKAARNIKRELNFDVSLGGYRLYVSWFKENMTGGFRAETNYMPFQYRDYEESMILSGFLTGPPQLEYIPYEDKNELRSVSHYENGSQTLKEGVEFTFNTERIPLLLTRFTINGAYFRTLYRNSMLVQERPSQVIAGRQVPYAGLYKDDDVHRYQQFNTNFTADTDIPKLKLGFAISAQFMWFTMSQRLPESVYPDEYMDPDGNIHEWTEDCMNDADLRLLKREMTDSWWVKYRVPICMNLNFKVTKRLFKDKLRVAMFCNKILSYYPSYESGSNNVTIRRHVKPYFGLEMNVNL